MLHAAAHTPTNRVADYTAVGANPLPCRAPQAAYLVSGMVPVAQVQRALALHGRQDERRVCLE